MLRAGGASGRAETGERRGKGGPAAGQGVAERRARRGSEPGKMIVHQLHAHATGHRSAGWGWTGKRCALPLGSEQHSRPLAAATGQRCWREAGSGGRVAPALGAAELRRRQRRCGRRPCNTLPDGGLRAGATAFGAAEDSVRRVAACGGDGDAAVFGAFMAVVFPAAGWRWCLSGEAAGAVPACCWRLSADGLLAMTLEGAVADDSATASWARGR